MIHELELAYARRIGWEEGYKEGLEIGRKKAKIEIITNMVGLGYSYEEINGIFPLTKEKYLKLKEDEGQ